MNPEIKREWENLQDTAFSILEEIMEFFPSSYRFTLVARNCSGMDDTDIILSNDVEDDIIAAIERKRDKMEVIK